MAVTSNELLQNILTSINDALQNSELTEDNRSALIDQYERTVTMIQNGFEYIEVGIDSLPAVIRDETILLLNDVIATFENVSQTLLNTLASDAETINTNLSNQVDTEIIDLSNSLSAFEISAIDLKALLVSDAETLNTNLTIQVDSKVIDLNNSLSAFEISATDLKALLTSDAESINADLSTQVDTKIADLESLPAIIRDESILLVNDGLELLSQNISNENLIINGGFNIWQRGDSFSDSSGFSADRWQIKNINTRVDKVIHSSGLKGARVYKDSADGIYSGISESIEIGEEISGKEVSLSFKIKLNKVIPSDASILLSWRTSLDTGDGSSSGCSYSSCGIDLNNLNDLQYGKFTMIVPDDAIEYYALRLFIKGTNNIGTNEYDFEIYEVKLEIGELCTPFQSRPYGIELDLCKRYYQKLDFLRVPTVCYVSTYFTTHISFSTEMRDVPSAVGNMTELKGFSLSSPLTVSYPTKDGVGIVSRSAESSDVGFGTFASGSITLDSEL